MDKDAGQCPGRPGRELHPARPEIARLLAAGWSVKGVVRELRRQGVRVSRRTVARVRDGERGISLLAPGEVRVNPPELCPQGHLVDILPCRLCALADLERQAQVRRLAASQRRPTTSGNENAPRDSRGC